MTTVDKFSGRLSDPASDSDGVLSAELGRNRAGRKSSFAIWSGFVVFVCLVLGFAGINLFNHAGRTRSEHTDELPAACQSPALRKEWRSLDIPEKLQYIEAIQCLKKRPSQLGLNHTLYDDFPWVHIHFGENCEPFILNSPINGDIALIVPCLQAHDAAPFLAWHRLFIHSYEQKLRQDCGYTGHLTYWDWTLDWENITVSPIWHNELGFGSDGDSTVGELLFNAHCVSEGPFAGLEVLYFEDVYRPHCLLRGFDRRLAEFRDALRPEALQEILSSSNYKSLNLGLENGPHIAIPKSVNGDFSLHSAPADPVFFLHHTQLDRLWWRWQQMDIEARSHEYEGLSGTNSEKQATLDDTLHMGGLIPDLKVADILRTETDVLCYRY